MGFVDAPVRVRVPATSANLGPGFDAVGLALAMHDDLTAEIAGDGLRIEVEGEGSGSVVRDESHLVVQAMHATFAELGREPGGLALHCHNRIPHSRGLGSSAAAIVAGVFLARALVRDGADRLSDGEVLALASALEGHPENVAPCLLGGLTIAWLNGSARAVRCNVDPDIEPVLLIAPCGASTEQARGLLPEAVPHSDAAFCASRSALLVAALTGAPEALLDATEDRLHQRYRASAIADSVQLVARLRADAHPAMISGAGPAVLVLARGAAEASEVTGAAPPGWRPVVLSVDGGGAAVLCPASADGRPRRPSRDARPAGRAAAY